MKITNPRILLVIQLIFIFWPWQVHAQPSEIDETAQYNAQNQRTHWFSRNRSTSEDSSFRQHRHSNRHTATHHNGSPRKIALLLPLSGKHADAAQAIREGFLASYYATGGAKPSVRLYDTSHASIHHLMDAAMREGAEMIVGPLDKEDVYQASQAAYNLRVPIIALNQLPQARAGSNFIQYSLAPETEAVQVAQKATEKGYRHACIIVTDNAWGKRVGHALSRQWQRLGGEVLSIVYANPQQDQSAMVRRLLGVKKHPTNTKKVAAVEGETQEEEPKRRQDVDVIFLAAPPDQARQLKPLLDFYYADDLPVYATSSVYSGTPNAKRDFDLNGIYFIDMPWLLDPKRAQAIQTLLESKSDRQSEQYNRLFAMGVDAYQLARHYGQLQHRGTIQGATGNLSLSGNNHIHRDLMWAKMKNGVPILVN